MERISLKEWIKKFVDEEFDYPSRENQIRAGWYDWFCRDTSLRNKTYKMGNIIQKITNENLLNNCYIFFKNNCPMVGPLYDDFRICDLKTGDVIYTVVIDDKRNNFKYIVYGIENDFKKPLFETNKSKELVNWLNNK